MKAWLVKQPDEDGNYFVRLVCARSGEDAVEIAMLEYDFDSLTVINPVRVPELDTDDDREGVCENERGLNRLCLVHNCLAHCEECGKESCQSLGLQLIGDRVLCPLCADPEPEEAE